MNAVRLYHTVLGGLFLAVFAHGSARAQAPRPGMVQGTLTINGEEMALRYAYAMVQMPEFLFPDAPKGEFELILTDKPLTDADLTCRTLLQFRVHKGAARGIILVFDPARQRPHRGALLYQKGPLFFSVQGTNEDHRFEPVALTATRVAGKAWTPKEFDSSVVEPLKFRYEATVDVPIRRPGPITATLTGAAAQNSPQTAALMAFCRAGRAGNLEGLRKVGVAAQMAILSDPEGKELLAAIRQGMPDPARLKVTKVIVRGDQAVIVGGGLSVPCVRDGGVWKIGLN